MNDELNVIAETEEYELYSDGRLMWLGGGQFEPVYKGIAALLTDAVRRLAKRIEAVEKRANTAQSMLLSLTTQIGELSARINAVESGQSDDLRVFDELNDRVAALERMERGSAEPEGASIVSPETYKAIRRELAREIATRLREGDAESVSDVHNWIEREYLDGD